MRLVVQRVSAAEVTVEDELVSRIETGFLVLVGVMEGDTLSDVAYCAKKLQGLRVFEDADGKMNQSVSDVGGSYLLVSQFTLAGDARNGNRPSFITAARPEAAEPLFDALVARMRESGLSVATGRFRTHMRVSLVNDGPVTILIDSGKAF